MSIPNMTLAVNEEQRAVQKRARTLAMIAARFPEPFFPPTRGGSDRRERKEHAARAVEWAIEIERLSFLYAISDRIAEKQTRQSGAT